MTDTTIPMEKLEPCPFCGDPMRNRHNVLGHVDQGGCIIGQLAWDDTKTAAWNTRALSATRPVVRPLEVAAENLLLHWDQNSGPEKIGSFEGVEYWSPAGRMVDTQFIVELRAALTSTAKETE